MHKILAIVGPTGTGKTARAIAEAKKTPSIIVSADSRQVYRGMDIVTGKDHPRGTILYGIDLVDPDKPCSVAVWHDAIMSRVLDAWEEGKQVIVVGGTGLYVRALTDGIETMAVPPNDSLRKFLSTLSLTKLQSKLKEKNPKKFQSMNESDKQNARRLIRAIEITDSGISMVQNPNALEVAIIGLKYGNVTKYQEAIQERVVDRLKEGAVEETKTLLSKYDRNLPSMSAIGYKSVINFIEGSYTKEEMIKQWVNDELRYAKRQMTWFAKVPQIKWYDSKREE